MAWNKYKAAAIARNRAARAGYTDENPRLMSAKFPGHCEHCGQLLNAGENMLYSYQSRKLWHPACFPLWKEKQTTAPAPQTAEPKTSTPEKHTCQFTTTCLLCGKPIIYGSEMVRDAGTTASYHWECFAAGQAAHIEPEPEPEPKPEPQTPDWLPVDFQHGTLAYSEYCDGLITHDSDAIYFSLIGSDSRVKGIAAYSLDRSRSTSWHDGITYRLDGERYGNRIQRKPEPTHYRRPTTKLGNGAQQIVALENFFTDGPLLEHDYRYLLFDPAEKDAADLVCQHIVENLPVPFMPTWTGPVFEQLRENARTWEQDNEQDLARCEVLEPRVGRMHAARIRVTEASMDSLISDMVKQGKISF